MINFKKMNSLLQQYSLDRCGSLYSWLWCSGMALVMFEYSSSPVLRAILHTLDTRLKQKHFYWSNSMKPWSTLFIFFLFSILQPENQGTFWHSPFSQSYWVSCLVTQWMELGWTFVWLVLPHLAMLESLWLSIGRKKC